MDKKISGFGIQCNEKGNFFGDKPIIVDLKDAEVVEEGKTVLCVTYMTKGNTYLSTPYFYNKGYGFMMDPSAKKLEKDARDVEKEDDYSEIPGSTFNMSDWWIYHRDHYFTLCKYGDSKDSYALVPKEWEKATGGYKRKKKRKPTKRKSTKRKSTKRRSKQRKYKKTKRRR